MDSLTFKPGNAFLSSNSPAVPWTAVFEDEGPAGYFYACDRSQETQEHSIMDAMLIYNGAALARPRQASGIVVRAVVERRPAGGTVPGRKRAGAGGFSRTRKLLPVELSKLSWRRAAPVAGAKTRMRGTMRRCRHLRPVSTKADAYKLQHKRAGINPALRTANPFTILM